MEVTINCPCGETYVFDVEPVNGQMPTGVNCPTCGADGTDLSNQFLAEHLGESGGHPPLRLQQQQAAPPPQEEEELPEYAPPSFPSAAGASAEEGGPSLLLGTCAAVGSGAVAMGIWYGLIMATGYELGIAAWGVGVLIGLSTLLVSKGGSSLLGLVAGCCALVAIVGGQFLVTKHSVGALLDQIVPGAYDEQMTFARSVLAANGDEELRAVLAEAYYGGFDPYYETVQISDAELASFRRDELPELQAFVNGTPSREEYEASLREFYHSPEMNWIFLTGSFSLFTLLWLFLGVGSAYRIARGGD